MIEEELLELDTTELEEKLGDEKELEEKLEDEKELEERDELKEEERVLEEKLEDEKELEERDELKEEELEDELILTHLTRHCGNVSPQRPNVQTFPLVQQ